MKPCELLVSRILSGERVYLSWSSGSECFEVTDDKGEVLARGTSSKQLSEWALDRGAEGVRWTPGATERAG